jgi:hypothetical protein
VIAVVPRGVVARRHFAAGAIALALFAYGVAGRSAIETGARVGLWARSDPSCLRTLSRWIAGVAGGGLFARLRLGPAPGGSSPRREARRIARALAALPPSQGGSLEERAFAGGALAA